MAKLSDLKRLFEAATPRQRALATPPNGTVIKVPPKRAVAATKHADGDVDITHAFSDVTRLRPNNKAGITRKTPSAVPRQSLADERDALEMSKYGNEPAPQAWDIGQEIEGEQTFLRPGLGRDVLTGLRRGRWVVQAEHDLHGMTTDEAHDSLADFLLEARARGMRCVRVIHGKGLRSKNREPVLKTKVANWLIQRDEVLAFCQARQVDGGGGAVMVLLKSAAK